MVIALVAVAGFLGVGCLCSGVLVALLMPAVQAAREAQRRSICMNHHKQIALSFHNYHDTYSYFPSNTYADDGSELHSWRTHVLPYVEMQNLHDRCNRDEPWSAPENAFMQDIEIATYMCPSNPSMPGTANYLTIFANPTTKPQPLLTKGVNVRFSDVMDGTSNTLMAVETAGSVQWVAVDDLSYETMPKSVSSGAGASGISSMHPGGANVSLADGSTRFLSSTISPDVLDALITRDGGEVMDIGF